jgi:hypothetical protein
MTAKRLLTDTGPDRETATADLDAQALELRSGFCIRSEAPLIFGRAGSVGASRVTPGQRVLTRFGLDTHLMTGVCDLRMPVWIGRHARKHLSDQLAEAITRRVLFGVVAVGAMTCGCGSDEAPLETTVANPVALPTVALERVSWPKAADFEPRGAFVSAHPEGFARMSGWVTHVSGPRKQRPNVGHRGAFGTGNGWVFALEGLADPLNTLHSLAGPTYRKPERFFGDYAVRLAPSEAADEPDFDEEWAARSLSAPVVLTRAKLGDVWLDTIDFAPSTTDGTLRGCFLRVLTVSNRGATTSGTYEIRIRAANGVTSPRPDALLETTKERSLTTAFADGGATVQGGVLRRKVGPLASGAEEQSTLVHCATEGAGAVDGPGIDVGALFDQTVAAYRAWENGLVQVELPDRMVADFIDGMKMTLKVQTSAQGASCPMSQYTRTWARDNIGPTLALLDLGAHDDVRAMMDYLYGAIVLKGDLANSYEGDLDVTALPPAPDWGAMPTLTDRVAAETPSYMVWIYGAYHQHTGRIDAAAERYGFLRRSLLAQGFGPDALLPFSGDETFRAAMNVAFGLGLNYAHDRLSWSANSSLLWLGAQKHFVRLATLLGHDDDVAEAQARAVQVEAGWRSAYLLPDGCVSPLRNRQSGETWPAPFEDVALQVTWAGWKDGDDALAREALSCLMRRLRVAPGRLQSPLNKETPNPLLPPDIDGMYTGMLPGYTLSALVETGHPEASSAFNQLGAALDTSGNVQEYNIAGDRSGLSLVYDKQGALGDYTAKFRPWEGGIDVSAALQYLLGYRPDHPGRRISLRPHLPLDWPSMVFRGLRAGADRFDVTVARVQSGHEVRVAASSSSDYQVELRWDAPQEQQLAVAVDGARLAGADVTRTTYEGMQSLRARAARLPASGSVTFWVGSPGP